MKDSLVGGLRHATAAAALACLVALGAANAAAKESNTPHSRALSALGDVEAAVGELDSASKLTVHSAEPYKAAAQRALDALAGTDGRNGQPPPPGSSADQEGAIRRLKWLDAHAGSALWKAAVQGAEVNATVAQEQLRKAIDADDLEQFQLSSSAALEALLVAMGRDSDAGPMGGLRGALATTELGVPEGAMMLSGCGAPKVTPGETPAYGVTNGYLVFVAIAEHQQNTRLPEAIGTRDVSVKNGTVVLYTAARDKVGTTCAGEGQASGLGDGNGRSSAAESPASAAPAAGRSGSGQQDKPDPPKLYTKAQAEQGKQVYAQNCAACHGDQLQGKTAPAIAGAAFLKKADLLGWSVADLRTIIVTQMPRSNPGSLSPDQYAAVIAFLLGKDCYPAGQDKFPSQATDRIKNAKLQPVSAADKNSGSGTCSVQQASK